MRVKRFCLRIFESPIFRHEGCFNHGMSSSHDNQQSQRKLPEKRSAPNPGQRKLQTVTVAVQVEATGAFQRRYTQSRLQQFSLR